MTKTGLDCQTEEGRRWMGEQDIAARTVCHYFPHLQMIESPDPAALWDYIAVDTRTGKVVAVMEVKSRAKAGSEELTAALVRDRGYLVTKEKVDILCRIAQALGDGVFPFLLVNIVPERVVIRITLQDGFGNWIEEPRASVTETRATCNGGTAWRKNYFVPVTDRNAKVYPIPDELTS